MSPTKTSAQFRTIDITIESLGGLGDGIATYENKPIFISKTCIGDNLRVRITEEKSDHRRGEIVAILAPGEHRITAPCSHYGDCGGCSLMHFSADSYRTFKQRNFESALRQGGFPDSKAEIVFLDAATRRRVEFKFTRNSMAYFRQRSHDLVPVSECHILEPALQNTMAPLAQMLSSFAAAEHIASVSLTSADSGIEMVLAMNIWRKDFSPALIDIAKTLGFQRISVTPPEGKIQVVADFSPVEMQLGGYAVAFPPDAFLQATREGQKILTDTILKTVTPDSHVADLFCGIGTYSFPLTNAATVHAVEMDPAMIRSLEANARRHGLGKKLSAEQRDLFKNPLLANELKRFATVVINPPRIGAKKQCEELAASEVKTVVMISCNPATWSRDAKTLKTGGFSLTEALGIDQFVYSPHFEIVSVFKR